MEREEAEGRWRAYDYKELAARDKASLDAFWLKDDALEASANLLDPDVIAAEIVEDQRAALAAFEERQSALPVLSRIPSAVHSMEVSSQVSDQNNERPDDVAANSFRQYLIDRLIDSIARIGGTRFERFGTRLVDMYTDVPMVHRGLDALGNPQGHIVDSISTDGKTAAEFGSVDRYFDGKLKKPTKDWDHVRGKHPNATRILLVSDERCGPAAHTALMNLPTSDPASAEIRLEVLDSQRIAEIIADKVLPSDAKVEVLAEFVPLLAQLRDEYVATHLAPAPVDDYVEREDVE